MKTVKVFVLRYIEKLPQVQKVINHIRERCEDVPHPGCTKSVLL